MVRVVAKGSSGGGLVAGKYHCLISSVENKEDDANPHVVVKFMVVAGTDADAFEKEHKEFFYLGETQVGRLIRLFCTCDLISMDEWKESEKAGEELDLNEAELEGRQCMIEIQLEEQKKKGDDGKYYGTGTSYPRVGFRMASVTDPKWKDVPKNPEYLKMIGIEDSGADSNGAAAESPAKPSPRQPAAARTTSPASAAGRPASTAGKFSRF